MGGGKKSGRRNRGCKDQETSYNKEAVRGAEEGWGDGSGGEAGGKLEVG